MSERYKIHNLDRAGSIPHVPLDTSNDWGMVVDLLQVEPHPLTGTPQPTAVFRGHIPDCVKWVRGRALLNEAIAKTNRVVAAESERLQAELAKSQALAADNARLRGERAYIRRQLIEWLVGRLDDLTSPAYRTNIVAEIDRIVPAEEIGDVYELDVDEQTANGIAATLKALDARTAGSQG